MLWMGEEWGARTPWCYFTSHADPDLAEAVRVGRRREFAAFGWAPEDVPDPQSAATFERSRLDWSEPDRPEHAELLEWHRALIALRRQHRLWEGPTQAELDGELIRVRRPGVVVLASLDGSPVPPPPSDAVVLLASESVLVLED
jgi:maltooligosyltrehalose trehalohydrolase